MTDVSQCSLEEPLWTTHASNAEGRPWADVMPCHITASSVVSSVSCTICSTSSNCLRPRALRLHEKRSGLPVWDWVRYLVVPTHATTLIVNPPPKTHRPASSPTHPTTRPANHPPTPTLPTYTTPRHITPHHTTSHHATRVTCV